MAIYAPDEATRAKLREFFSYNPETGSLRWAKKYVNRHVGAECSTVDNQGYRRVQFLRREYAVHRLAWFLHYGEWPAQLLDHINRDRMDNRIANLRLATYSLNALNAPDRGHLTEAERQQVCDLYQSGKSGDQIALMFNRDKTTINKILRKRGIAARPQRQRSAALPPPVIKHPVEKLWREVGLPEWFLGNGGTNTKLYALYDAILSLPVQSAPDRETAAEIIAQRIYGSKLQDLEGVQMDNCRDIVTEILEAGQSGAGEREAIDLLRAVWADIEFAATNAPTDDYHGDISDETVARLSVLRFPERTK